MSFPSSTHPPGRQDEQDDDGIFTDPRLDPEIETHGWDGVAWDIKQYAPDGTVERSTGDTIYIYGHQNLENLVNLLPRQDKRNGSDGYISVQTKQQQEKNA